MSIRQLSLARKWRGLGERVKATRGEWRKAVLKCHKKQKDQAN